MEVFGYGFGCEEGVCSSDTMAISRKREKAEDVDIG
jgi:hypothetical protein